MLAIVVGSDADKDRRSLLVQVLQKIECDVLFVKLIREAVNAPEFSISSGAILVVIGAHDSKHDVGEILRHSTAIAGRAFVLYITDRISPEDYKALVRSGWADSTDWKGSIKEIEAAVRRLRERGATTGGIAPAQPVQQRRVAAFVGTGAGSGNTTLAMEAAIFLASQKGKDARRVALLDLDFQSSVVCDYLDIPPRLEVGAFVKTPDRLDSYMLNILASEHSSSLSVFASSGPSEGYRSENELSAILLLLNKLLEHYDIVVVDIPAYVRFQFDEILRNADLVIVTSRFSIPSVKQASKMLLRLQELGVAGNRTVVAITQAETNLFGAVSQRFKLERLLKREQFFFVREDRDFALESVDAGRAMMQNQPGRGVCQDIRKIAERIKNIDVKHLP